MEKNLLKKAKEKGITLIALVVTIVVLLILAGVSIVVLWGDHGILKTAEDSTTKFGVEAEREKINNVLVEWWTKKVTGENVTVKNFFEMLITAGIIDNVEKDVTGPDENNTYIVETNSGYTVEIILDENGNIQIGDIEKGALAPKIRDIKISTTENSITAKAIVARVEGKAIKYEYKLETEPDSSYQEMTIGADGTATATGLTANASYKVRVTILPTEPLVVEERTVIARDCTVTGITLDKTAENIDEGKTTQLTATIEPEYAEDKSITWTSSDEEVATVNSTGLVTAKTVGTATITATANGGTNKTATCTITVLEAESDWEYLGRVAKSIATRTDITINSDTPSVSGKTENNEEYNISVGDTFKVRYNKEDYPGLRTVRVIGFKHDDLVNTAVYGSGTNVSKAGITFDFVDFLTDPIWMAMGPNGNYKNGWAAMQLRKDLNGYTTNDASQDGSIGGLAALLSNSSQIKQVKKEYMPNSTSETLSESPAEDYLWLLSCGEIWSDGYNGGDTKGYARNTEGNQYAYYKKVTDGIAWNSNNAGLVKKANSTGSISDWWLRSYHYNFSSRFCTVNSRGYCDDGTYSNPRGVAPGFSI